MHQQIHMPPPVDLWEFHDEPGYRRELSGEFPGIFSLSRYAVSPSTQRVVFDTSEPCEAEVRVYGPRESMVWSCCPLNDARIYYFLKCLMFRLDQQGTLATA